MTPEQLAVERDALLQGGRTLEEVEAMQLVAGSVSFDAAHTLALPASEDAEGAQIYGGRRCSVYRHWDDWWVGISPRNGHGASVEGSWDEWVALARGIVAVEALRRLSPPESASGASAPRPSGETRSPISEKAVEP